MMLVLLLCIVMKIAEISVGRTSPTARPLTPPSPPPPPSPSPSPSPSPPPPPTCNRRCRRCRRYRTRRQSYGDRCISRKFTSSVAGEDAPVMEEPETPGSDCNSNPATDSIQQDLVGSEFVQDNVEYQWFIDYGYRDGGGLHIHPSVLSSLSASYSPKDLGYYDDLARNLDANLAEIDMESFRTADIHTLLTALPVMCTEPVQHSEFNYQREQYASISGSVMEKLDIGSSISPHTSSQGEDSACSTADTISICKSSLLFSPVKETPMLPPGGSYSVDSLDCEDMLLTCQTNNKNNYTIAFEGSMTMYSDGSQDFENHDKHKTYEPSDIFYDKQKDMKTMLDLSMACSDSKIYTTWSNLKHSSMNKVITRHPSGNNNTLPDISQNAANLTLGEMNKRSQSLPDLSRVREFQHTNIPLNFSIDSAESSNHMQRLHSSGSAMSRSINAESSDNGESAGTKKLQNLSLVRLFMKQKSMSVEGMSLTLDQSDSISDNSGWPTSNSGSDSATNTNTQIQRQSGQDNVCRVSENDFSINWIRRDTINNHDMENQRENLNVLKCATRNNKDDKIEMASSASVEELSESVSKSDCMSDQRSFDNNVLFEHQQRNGWIGLMEKKHPICRTTGIQANAEMEDNAVQTSLIFTAMKEKYSPLLQEMTVNKKPVYVVYPNYTLPDLSFLKKDTKIDNIALKPHTFDKNKMEWKRTLRSGRPFSCNDIDALRQRGFAHVKDWESLTFLLPYEYKKILHDVPEVSRYININEEVKRPLFCLSPPMRHKTRPISEIIPNNTSSTSSTATQPSSGYRGSSTILTDSSTNQQPLTNNAINPLYLYRYDSISSEASLVNNDRKMHRFNQTRQACPSLSKRSVSLPQGEGEPEFNNGRVPPRPPLPRSILRKNKVLASKRYSMFEMGDVGEQSEESQSVEINKRMSLQEPYYMNNDLQLLCRERTIDSEKDVDETEAERYLREKLNDIMNNANAESETSQQSDDDIKQLEEYLKRSAISSQSSDGDIDNAEVKVRSYVRKFLALKMNKDPLIRNIDMGESQRKTVSFAVHQRKKHLDSKLNNLNVVVNEQSQDQADEDKLMELEEKKKMVSSVNKAVDLLLKYWNADSNHSRPNYNERNECAQICLSNLCPALYAIMSDGLKPHLNSTFGPITNSVWQVVEASSQQGPLTKTLNELVQRINGEDVITEGMLKFHAFVFGLLNLRALDAWFAYLCTRESILRKHYNNHSLFVAALANANVREIVDSLLYILNPLAFCPFHLDLLYQYRQLQNSFGNINGHTVNVTSFRNVDMKDLETEKTESWGIAPSPKKTRPRSCIAYNMDDKCNTVYKGDLQNAAKKRFSAISPKTFYALDKLTSEDSEDYTDSLEHSPLNRKASKRSQQSKLFSPDTTKPNDDDGFSGETKFKKLQEKWELMIGKEGNKAQPAVMTPSSPVRTFGVLGKSKIPRLLTSPVKQSNVAANAVGKSSKSPVSAISSLKKPANLPTTKPTPKKPMDAKMRDVTRRTSRVDQDTLGVTRTHTARPSSLPYKSHGVTSNDKNLISPHRRAVSTSLPRPTATVSRTPVSKQSHKEVRTLTHRIPSDTGHLSFAEGEKLKVILEVDNKWLLCAKGDRRGLVPRACVHSIQT
ncbi:uncharacterized protein LOC105433279 isoform X2 [Pogonomyrmex barbatus]|uniref:Uncharacterized protein LOC105433279 isoform X2 n=1 Tax=Pogonomyrmex barbatus TaxID=144034 RepID=A0A6I9X2J7_9HYME|nr:uncharacterized protein LOC105433279 isoform X2 [Pogonomyrmex barbatus]